MLVFLLKCFFKALRNSKSLYQDAILHVSALLVLVAYKEDKGLQNPLTTEVLRPDMTGSWTSPQLLPCWLQAGMRSVTFSGSVAVFTSDKPFAHAAELTSHMKVNTHVTPKSWKKGTILMFALIFLYLMALFFITGLSLDGGRDSIMP